jgi:signal peptidase II
VNGAPASSALGDEHDRHGERPHRGRRAAAVALAIAGIAGADQALKVLARAHLAGAPPIAFLGGAVRFEYAENRGAFLSLGESLPEVVRFGLFVLLVGAALAAALAFALRARAVPAPELAALALMAGGGLGNLIDRIARHGAVVDYVSVGVGPLRTGILNLADAAITAGALLFLWSSLRQGREAPDTSPG